MGGLQIAKLPELHEGNAVAAQFDLYQVTVVRGPKQHDLLPQRDTGFEVLQDCRAYGFGLALLIRACSQDRSGSALLLGPKPLR